MIILPHHLRLIQRQPPLLPLHKPIPPQRKARFLQLGAGFEEVGVVGHMEHRHKGNPPRILSRLLVDQHRRAAVNLLGQLGILAGAENRTSLGIRIDAQKILPAQTKGAGRIFQIARILQEKAEIGFLTGT